MPEPLSDDAWKLLKELADAKKHPETDVTTKPARELRDEGCLRVLIDGRGSAAAEEPIRFVEVTDRGKAALKDPSTLLPKEPPAAK